MQKIANKLTNCEEFVAKKQIEQDKQQLMNCPCIKRGILRPLTQLSTQIRDRINLIPCQMQKNFTILNQGAALERPTFPIKPPLF